MPFSSDSILRLTLFAAGPGLYFDFAGLIFQVPECSSAAAAVTLRARATSSSAVAKIANLFIRIIYLRLEYLAGPVADVMVGNPSKVQQILADFRGPARVDHRVKRRSSG